MVWDEIEAIRIFGVNVGIVFVLLASGIVFDVKKLIVEVVGVSYAVLVIALVPDFSRGVLAGCEGVCAFDELDALRC